MNNIILGISLPWTGTGWPAGEGVSPALLKAIETVNNDPDLLPNHTLQWFWYDTQCDPDYAHLGLDAFKAFEPHAMIGPGCSSVVKAMVDAFEESNTEFSVPLISWAAANPAFADKVKYPMFSRLVASYIGHNTALVSLADYYGWDSIAVLAEDAPLWNTTSRLLQSSLLTESLTRPSATSVAAFVAADSSDLSEFAAECAEAGTRVLVLLGYCPQVKAWVHELSTRGMLEGYAVITYDIDSNCETGDDTFESVASLTGIWSLAARAPTSLGQEQFLADLNSDDSPYDFTEYLSFPFGTASANSGAHTDAFRDAMAQGNRTFVPGRSVSNSYALFLHDSIMLFAEAAHQLITDTDYYDGSSAVPPLNMINNYIKGLSLEGASGQVDLDSKGERNLPVAISYLVVEDDL
jgi:hypothetical protein